MSIGDGFAIQLWIHGPSRRSVQGQVMTKAVMSIQTMVKVDGVEKAWGFRQIKQNNLLKCWAESSIHCVMTICDYILFDSAY
jgi:hypothetical protein